MNFKDTFKMSNETYDRLKYIVQIILPALATFVGLIGVALDLPNTEMNVTVLTAIIACLGTVLGVSSTNYHKSN